MVRFVSFKCCNARTETRLKMNKFAQLQHPDLMHLEATVAVSEPEPVSVKVVNELSMDSAL